LLGRAPSAPSPVGAACFVAPARRRPASIVMLSLERGQRDPGWWHEPGRVLPGSHPGAHLKSVITSGHVIGLAPSEICVPSGTVHQYSVRNAAAATSL